MIGGPLSARELGQFVRATLEDDRAKLQGVIDMQLQRLSASGWSGSLSVPDLPRVEHTPSRDSTQQAEPQFEEIQLIPPTPATQSRLPAAPARPATKLLALGAVLLALMIVFVIVLVWSNKHEAPTTTAQTTPPPPVTPTAAPPSTTVRLEIVASPANAVLTLDGKPLGENPYVGAVVRDGKVHELAVSAAGFSPLTQEVAADRDLNLRLNLVPAPVVPHVTTKPPVVAKAPPIRKIKKVEPKVEAKVEPPVEDKKPAVTTSNKHGIDTDVYAKPGSKRSLDSNVLDGSGKPTIDRENPWQK
jgi:PEGA domain